MTDFDFNKIRRLDGTVLLVFSELMRLRKASDVAVSLGLTNSAISHALRRLRDVFGDELFLRRPHGLEPTAFALEVEPAITRSLLQMQEALAGPKGFDPASARAHLRVSAYDYEVGTLVPDLLADLTAKAPGLDVSILSLVRQSAVQALMDGALDIAFGFFPNADERLLTHQLMRERYLVAGRKDHPAFAGPLSLEAYVAADHALVSQDRTMRGIVDQALAGLGKQRRVRVSLPSFFPALFLASRSDLLVTIPYKIDSRNADRFGLSYVPPPLEIRSFPLQLAYHRRDQRGAMLGWVLGRIRTFMTKHD